MGPNGSSARFRLLALLAAACLVLPTAASLEALEHLGHHAASDDFVHAEAAHPDAAPHLEREEHLHGESCVVCANGTTGGATAAPAEDHTSPATTRLTQDGTISVPTAAPVSRPARAPPA